MSKVRAPVLKGEGFPAVLQPGPVHWTSIGAIISGPVAEAAAGQFVSGHQSISAHSFLPGVPTTCGLSEGGF